MSGCSSSEDASFSPSLFFRAQQRRGERSWEKMRDGEERVIGSSSWHRGSLADGDSSTPRWKSRAPAALPMDIAMSPGKHVVIVLAWA